MSDVETAVAVPTAAGAAAGEKPRSLAGDAWRDLRRSPIFILSLLLLIVLTVMAIAPGLFTDKDPSAPGFCELGRSAQPPRDGAVFGNDYQGCDVYTLTIYGARASMLVGLFTSAIILVVGVLVGVLAGYFGGWVDAVLSRFTDVFFSIPLLLGGILVLTAFPATEGGSALAAIMKVVLALSILAWPTMARVMRSATVQVREADYVEAARALGARNRRILWRHILPNVLAPGIVVATISLGVFIGAEATLSYLGIGLQKPAISWGLAINDAQGFVSYAPHMLLFPAVFLSATVLAFIMLGDAVRDAFDPKMR